MTASVARARLSWMSCAMNIEEWHGVITTTKLRKFRPVVETRVCRRYRKAMLSLLQASTTLVADAAKLGYSFGRGAQYIYGVGVHCRPWARQTIITKEDASQPFIPLREGFSNTNTHWKEVESIEVSSRTFVLTQVLCSTRAACSIHNTEETTSPEARFSIRHRITEHPIFESC